MGKIDIMALPETERQRVDHLLGQLCEQRGIPDQVRLRYDTRGNRVTLTESRPLFIDPAVWNEIRIAQFEYTPETLRWTLKIAVNRIPRGGTRTRLRD
jgi:hypothetical protein